MKNSSNQVGILANIKLELGVASVLSIVGAIFIASFIFFPNFREELKFSAMVIGGITAIYSAYYVGARLKEEVRRSSVRNALELFKSFDDIKMAEIRSFIEEEYNKTTPDEFDKKIRENFELSRNIAKL